MRNESIGNHLLLAPREMTGRARPVTTSPVRGVRWLLPMGLPRSDEVWTRRQRS
jgi:hypothetical protein